MSNYKMGTRVTVELLHKRTDITKTLSGVVIGRTPKRFTVELETGLTITFNNSGVVYNNPLKNTYLVFLV